MALLRSAARTPLRNALCQRLLGGVVVERGFGGGGVGGVSVGAAERMNLIRQLQKGTESKKLVVVDFTASWCGPCHLMAPIFAELAKKLPNVLFLKVDVDELQSVSVECKVEAMPTFLLFKEGQVVDKVVGAHKEELQALITKHATDAVAA